MGATAALAAIDTLSPRELTFSEEGVDYFLRKPCVF